MDISKSKTILAKLLAQENLTVVHNHKASTTSFEPKRRILTLPVWKDMDGDLYDLLVGHEVGHAQYTPAEGWHNAICGPDGDIKHADHNFKGFLNIIEDARIEKKIKSRFPGLRGNFYRAYANLHDRDFFGLEDKNVDDLLLIDRINIHFKIGSFVRVAFKEEEKVYIQRTERLDTWEEVEALARELYEKAKEEVQEGKRKILINLGAMQDGEDNDNDNKIPLEIDIDELIEKSDLSEEEKKQLRKNMAPRALTDESFRERERELVDHGSAAYHYYNLPDYDSRNYIITHRQVAEQLIYSDTQLPYVPALNQEFKQKNEKFINYLVKEFELRRNAEQQARAKISKSGELDMKKIFNYQLTEDIFRRFTTLPKGKNHGLVMFYDMSGSMTSQMASVIEQIIVLVEFCRKVSIPYEVYGFSNMPLGDEHHNRVIAADSKVTGDILIHDINFSLRQFFTDSMTVNQYKHMKSMLLLEACAYRSRHGKHNDYNGVMIPNYGIPDYQRLNGTPLNPALLVSLDVYKRFVERTKAEVVNMVVLTDGDSDGGLCYCSDKHWSKTQTIANPGTGHVYVTHGKTKKQVKIDVADTRQTKSLVKLIRMVTGVNIVCFDIVGSSKRSVINNKFFRYNAYANDNQAKAEVMTKQFRKDGIFVHTENGWSEHYLILGSDLDIYDDELDVDDNATKGEILKAFNNMRKNKNGSRILLNRFIGMIA